MALFNDSSSVVFALWGLVVCCAFGGEGHIVCPFRGLLRAALRIIESSGSSSPLSLGSCSRAIVVAVVKT